MGASDDSKEKTKQMESAPKFRLRRTAKSAPLSSSNSSSILGPQQPTGTVKRQRTLASRYPNELKGMATPRPVKDSATAFALVATSHDTRKTKENVSNTGSSIKMPASLAGSPNVSRRTSSSAPHPQARESISGTEANLGPNISRTTRSSLPTSLSNSNIPSSFSTPKLRGPLKKTRLASTLGMPSNAPNISENSAHTSKSNAPREGSNSMLRPSLLKAPSIMRFKK